MEAIVLAGGPSVLECDPRWLHERGFLIGVNDSCVRVKCDVGLTMDRRWWEGRQEELLYAREKYGLTEFWMREGINKKGYKDRWVSWFKCPHRDSRLSVTPGELCGMNSGICAINYAMQMQPEVIWLLGFDMKKGERPYWYDEYPWAPGGATKPGNYRAWNAMMFLVHKQLDDAGIRAYSVGDTAMTAFPNVSYKDFLKG